MTAPGSWSPARVPAVAAPARGRRDPVGRWALAAAAIGCVAYLWWSPQAPDLAAQVARAGVARDAGWALWWTGWFGGLSLPTYSLLSPQLMAHLGVTGAGVLAVLTGSLGTARLVAQAARPRAGAVAFALAQVGDLLAGRVTFALGFAAAAWALVTVRSGRRLPAAGLAAATFLLSPLAGMFLGVGLLAVVLGTATSHGGRRRAAAGAGCAALLGLAAATGWLFPDPGTMPFSTAAAEPAVLAAVLVAVLCPGRIVRAGALLALLATLGFLVVPGAVGVNVTRLSWIAAVPTMIACARAPSPLARRLGRSAAGSGRQRGRGGRYGWNGRPWTATRADAVLAAVGAAVVAVAPVSDLVTQVGLGADRSARQAFYAPLNGELARQQAVGGGAAGGARVEVVDPADHWSSAYVTAASLARGWERQADLADNPLFYGREPLTAQSYRAWLGRLAVGWVALPAVRLDGAAQAEAALVRSGPDYLEPVWRSPDWILYRVRDATPLATGARIARLGTDRVTLIPDGPGPVSLRVRWNPYLTLVDPVTGAPARGCVTRDGGGWVRLRVRAATTVALVARFDPLRRVGARQACPA